MVGKYDGLTKSQLIALLEKHDRQKPLGLVWERNAIEADQAISADFVACDIIPDLCERAAPWRNLVIEGDNYDALRWLRMAYSGRVKCIYIDPPYNTGNKDWVYNDHYFDANDRYRHSTWLEFLYRRLTLARDLLTEDGVILASINDDNRARLELLMNEALPGMRIGSLVWRTRDTTAAKGKNFSDVHEHVLVYGKEDFEFRGSDKSSKKYRNPDNDPRGKWNIDPLTLAFDRKERENLYYPIENPKTGIWYQCDPDRVWAYASKRRLKEGQKTRAPTMEEQIADNMIVFPSRGDERVVIWNSLAEIKEAIRNGDVQKTPRDQKPLIRADDDNLEIWIGKSVGFGRPGYKKFWLKLKSHISPLSSWIARKGEDGSDQLEVLTTGSGGEGTNEIQRLFGGKEFPNPKPSSLIRQLICQSTFDDDLVLDFFAGSATTAQAVMELNAEDDGRRRFIVVSSTEATEDEPDKNLCRHVTARRIRLLNASEDPKFVNLATEFVYLRARKVNFEDLDYDLKPREAWAILEAMHDLPLTPLDADKSWQVHQTEALTLVYVDRCDEELLAFLMQLGKSRANAFVYAWAPGQIQEGLHDVTLDVQGLRPTLVKRFQQ